MAGLGHSEAVTDGVRIQVKSRYLRERSNPTVRQFMFTYDITIRNESPAPVKLLTRHWVIRDATGAEQKVEGVGVIGETPVIEPGATHRYSSFCPLRTEFGSMEGSYGMVRSSGETFRAKIATFSLFVPSAVS